MSTFNQNSGTAVPTLINSSATILTANAVSSNALTVRQFGTGNVFSAQTTTGSTALFVGADGNVGVGTTGPVYQLSVATGLGATATPTVQILDTVGPKSLSVVTNASSGVYNAMVATGDPLLVGGVGSTVNTGVLTLAPWSAGSVGARIGGSSNIFGIYSNATTFYSNAVSPATVMTVVNGRVGVGTTNPSQLLDIYGGANTALRIRSSAVGSTRNVGISLENSNSTTPAGIYMDGADKMAFYTFGSARMAIDFNGNVGIGTTSPGNLLVVQGSGAAGRSEFGGDFIELGAGRTSDGSSYIDFHSAEATYPDYALRIIRFGGANAATQILHRGTGEISYVTVDAGDHAWYTSNAEKMRLTSAGRLGIGTTDPKGTFNVLSGNAGYPDTTGSGSSNVAARIQSGSICLDFGSIGGTNPFWIQNHLNTNNATNYPILLNPNGGNVGVGTTNPEATLGVGARVGPMYNAIGGPVAVFGVSPSNPTTAGTGTIGGTLYVNGTGAYARNTGGSIAIGGRGADFGGGQQHMTFARIQGVQDNGTDGYAGTFVVEVQYNGTLYERMRINSGGTCYIYSLAGTGNRAVYSDASGALTNTSSDQRLKSNVFNITYGLDTVSKLRPVFYNWSNVETRGSQVEIGFIAQEIQQYIPEVIGENSDGMLSLDYSKLTAVLTKAIQELSAENTALRTKFAAMEQSLATATANVSSLEARLAALESKLAA
jgi:hypothetical protein